jgi:heme exporter protein A
MTTPSHLTPQRVDGSQQPMHLPPESEDVNEPQAIQPSSPPILLDLKGVKKSFVLKPILRKIDLTLHRSERLALLGANGAGKTTLLRILAALTQPDSGTILLNGLDLRHDAQQIRHLVGFLAHDPFLYEELTALENLLFFAKLYSLSDARDRARELLRCVGLERRMQDRAGTFSRGMLQRLAWARALLHRPLLLLLDEPETGLDQEGYSLMTALLAEHTSQGGSTIFTTHRLEQAIEHSDHLLILHGGRIVFRQRTSQTTLEALSRTYQEVVR